MSRCLVLLSHSLHVRNFVASGWLEMLAGRGHEVTVLVPRNLLAGVREAGTSVHSIVAMEPYLAGRMKSRFRAWCRVASFIHRSGYGTYRHKIRLNRSLRFRFQIALFRRLERYWDLERIAERVEVALAPRRAALRFLREMRPDVFFFPTLIHDGAEVELLKAARRLRVPTVGFVASWDTLTSKGAFTTRPDHLLVWGEESRIQATQHHAFAPAQISVTGAPHFDVYGPAVIPEPRAQFLASRGIDPGKHVLLLAGTTVTYWGDEPRLIQALSAMIHCGDLNGVVIWYRPHPRRGPASIAEIERLPHVYVDDQMRRHKSERVASYSMRPDDLRNYRNLVNAVDGIITAFSTMIIEGALLEKPSLVVAFGEGGSGRLIEHSQYEHLQHVLATPGVTLCQSLKELKQGIDRLVTGDFAPLGTTLRASALRIAANADGRARLRIVEAVERAARRPEAQE